MAVKGLAGCCCCCAAVPSDLMICRETPEGPRWSIDDTLQVTITGCEGFNLDCTLTTKFIESALGVVYRAILSSDTGCDHLVVVDLWYHHTADGFDCWYMPIDNGFFVCGGAWDGEIDFGSGFGFSGLTVCDDSECYMGLYRPDPIGQPETRCIKVFEGAAATEETVCNQCCPDITFEITGGGGTSTWWCVRDDDPESLRPGCVVCVSTADGEEPARGTVVGGPYDSAAECDEGGCGRYYCVSGSCQFLACPPEGQTYDDGWDTIEECQATDCEDPDPGTDWYCVEVGETIPPDRICVSQPTGDPPPAGAISGPHATSTVCEQTCCYWYCVQYGEAAPECLCSDTGVFPEDPGPPIVVGPFLTQAECEASCGP